MENKLQELTRKLYDEGLSKGRSEAEKMVADAQQKARQIVADAQAQADDIVRQARKAADDLSKNSLTEIALAGRQAVNAVKERIGSLIVAKTLSASVKEANMDAGFVKKMLLAVAAGWNGGSSEKVSLEALLPADRQAELDAAFKNSVSELLAAGIEVGYSDRVKSGFKVGARDGGYYISFSDEDFDALLGQYLREKVSKILYQAD